jgi:hypothetical protein
LMQVKSAPKGPSNASDSFFGEDDSLGTGSVPPPAAGAKLPPTVSMPEYAAAGIPKAPPSWLMLAIVGGSALLLGIVIVLVLVLR